MRKILLKTSKKAKEPCTALKTKQKPPFYPIGFVF